MTVPKFRAWYKKGTLPMLKVNLISFDQQFTDVYIDDEAVAETEMSFDFDDVILMQSTGLFDKNGVEIYEGDIIVAMSQGVKAIGEVKRRIDGCWLMHPAWQHGELWHIVENVDTGETGVEVIGNIYEHPELVEE
ncbi:YopX family protein [Streptococcus pluranimalium]|uniref:YopX family protein n=1 Tax=Streptococcus pluranimalium TaxID=82348 RepID=UPI0029318205|nr:YopX family protein [Streptococcus pluranimalium]